MDGLYQLQNRGYDSAGITVVSGPKFVTFKRATTEKESAIDYLKRNNINGTIGLAHTRWATHGAKTDLNSHPHTSNCGKFVLVHNGIIENFKYLENFLIENDYVMKSQTDTEIIVNLISFYYTKYNSVEKALEIIIEIMEGTWGLVLMCIDFPNNLYVTR